MPIGHKMRKNKDGRTKSTHSPEPGISEAIHLYSASNRLGLAQSSLVSKILGANSAKGTMSNQTNRLLGGHPVVRENLIAGLRELGGEFRLNPLPSGPEAVRLVLAGKRVAAKLLKEKGGIHAIGPNFCVTPRENITILSSPKVEKIVVPSKESALFFSIELPEIAEKLEIWPVGVDHLFWKTDSPSERKDTIALYLKTTDNSLIDLTIQNLKKAGYSLELIRYGSYSKPQFKAILSRSKAVVWLGHFESQGIAQFEAWSTGVPTFIFKSSGDVLFSVPYHGIVGVMPEETWSPSPYLTPPAGAFWNSQQQLLHLLEEADAGCVDYDPRRFIIQRHTLKKSVMQLLRKIA